MRSIQGSGVKEDDQCGYINKEIQSETRRAVTLLNCGATVTASPDAQMESHESSPNSIKSHQSIRV